MNKSLDAHKKELQEMQFAQKIALKEQIEGTVNVTTHVAKLALIGGASAYIGIKVVGFVGGKIFGKKKKNESQIIYVQAPQNHQSTGASKSFWKGVASSALAALLPMVTNFAKQAGTKAAEKYAADLMEKYKDKLNLDKFFKS